MRKQSSTNFQNEAMIITECPIYNSTRLISARWKTHILWMLRSRPLRFGEIKRAIPLATERMIALRLHELCEDELVEKFESKTFSSYRLTSRGKKLIPVLNKLLKIGVVDSTKIKKI